jgi:hypothetical protein
MAKSTERRPKTKKVTVRQQLAIDVILVGGTDQQAADKAGVSRSTVTKWRNDPGSMVAEELDQQREATRRRHNLRIVAAQPLAARALEESVKNLSSPAVRVSAARAILTHGMRANEGEEIETSKLEFIFDRLKAGLDRLEYEKALEALLGEGPNSHAKSYPHLERFAERRLEAVRREPVPEFLRQPQGGGVIVLPAKETEPAAEVEQPLKESQEADHADHRS